MLAKLAGGAFLSVTWQTEGQKMVRRARHCTQTAPNCSGELPLPGTLTPTHVTEHHCGAGRFSSPISRDPAILKECLSQGWIYVSC